MISNPAWAIFWVLLALALVFVFAVTCYRGGEILGSWAAMMIACDKAYKEWATLVGKYNEAKFKA